MDVAFDAKSAISRAGMGADNRHLTGIAFGIAYRRSHLLQAVALLIFSGMVEVLQGRQVDMLD
jgi:hypothetical protein